MTLRAVPANFGPLRGPHGHARITGPCGDTMEFWILADAARLVRVAFTTDGCAHSMAAGSACARLAEGRAFDEVARIEADDVSAAAGGLPETSRHCALLAVNTLREALAALPHREATADSPRDAKPASPAPGENPVLKDRLAHIRHKVLVLSGKGGVGKSTVAVGLAMSLARSGKRVGLLDVDLHGPSVPKLLGVEGTPVEGRGDALLPVTTAGVKVMSIGLLLSNPEGPVIWRGPMKMHVIERLLRDVEWGDLDVLVIDLPPGTGDEPLSICQLIPGADGAIVVTTPQDVATANVRRSVRFCRELKLPVLGVIENMSGFVCPSCGTTTFVFGSGGGERMAVEMGVRFLGRVPLDAQLAQAGDRGLASERCPQSAAAGREALERAFAAVLASLDGETHTEEERRTR